MFSPVSRRWESLPTTFSSVVTVYSSEFPSVDTAVCGNGGHCDRCGYCIDGETRRENQCVGETRRENQCVGEDGRVYGASDADCPTGEVSEGDVAHVDSGRGTHLLFSRAARLSRILRRRLGDGLRRDDLHVQLLRAAGSPHSPPLLQNVDCMGICNGEAFLDDCGVCSGGTSGRLSSLLSRRAQGELRQGLRRRVLRNESLRLQRPRKCDDNRRHAHSRRHARHLQRLHLAFSLQHR